MATDETKENPALLTSSDSFFKEVVEEAFENQGVKARPLSQHYLVQLLQHYMFADNLFDKDEETGKTKNRTLAESYLIALQSERRVKLDLLKKLGDSSLYISGFFGDSLKRKIIDLDYYAQMGGAAYQSLAAENEGHVFAEVYLEIAEKFYEFTDVLTYISQKSLIQSTDDLLRLYDRYLVTGSKLAEEQLIEKGLLHIDLKKAKGQ